MPVYRGRTPGTWRVVIWSKGLCSEQIVRGPKRAALECEAELRLRAPREPERRAGLTVAQMSAGPYAAHAEVRLRADTWRVRQSQLRAVAARMGQVRVSDVSTASVEAYQAARLRDGVMSSTVNNEVRVLLRMLRWAASVGYRVTVPSARRLVQLRPRVRAWTAEEIARLYAAARIECPHLLPMIITMANTGLRRGEAMRAEWSWVDWSAGLLRLPVLPDWQPKNGKPRDVPVGPAVRAAMTPRGTTGPLFPRLDGEHYREWPKELWQAARDRAGLSGGAHQLRHTFASHFLRRVPDLHRLARVLGHSSTRTTELYAHLLPGDLDGLGDAVNLAPELETMAGTVAEAPTPRRKRYKTS